MLIVLFEVELFNETAKDSYLSIAKQLQSELIQQKGFLRLERFQSIEHQNKMVSIQYWENEKAISQWKHNRKHQAVMPLGKSKLFKNYKISILQTIRSYTK